jgi:hypothetical protein
VDDIEGRAAAQAQQRHFHRAHAEVLVKSLGLRFYRLFATLSV